MVLHVQSQHLRSMYGGDAGGQARAGLCGGGGQPANSETLFQTEKGGDRELRLQCAHHVL